MQNSGIEVIKRLVRRYYRESVLVAVEKGVLLSLWRLTYKYLEKKIKINNLKKNKKCFEDSTAISFPLKTLDIELMLVRAHISFLVKETAIGLQKI